MVARARRAMVSSGVSLADGDRHRRLAKQCSAAVAIQYIAEQRSVRATQPCHRSPVASTDCQSRDRHANQPVRHIAHPCGNLRHVRGVFSFKPCPFRGGFVELRSQPPRTLVQRDSRDARLVVRMERLNWLWQDLRYAARGIRKDRGFALVAMLALALGIGATTVIFSVIENVLIEPFAYRNADRLAVVYVHDVSKPDSDGSSFYNVPEFLDIREQNHVFDEVMGVTPLDVLYQEKESTQQFTGASVTANSFEMLGMKPTARPEHRSRRR